jgi:hypothetical protein
MAGPAIEALFVVGGLYVRGPRLHAECDIDMAESARIDASMKPVTELDGRQARLLGIIIDHDIAELMRQRPLLFYTRLSQRKTGDEDENEDNENNSFHDELLSAWRIRSLSAVQQTTRGYYKRTFHGKRFVRARCR